ncbi:MAG TPA: phosphoglycerate kinase [Hyphomicrobiaceae bacterium]|jgi:phosphoglycerate kinase|nr:phosphoglycerate kinase [Hyphomicrobiaceae bacterium]
MTFDKLKSTAGLNLTGKRVLVRADLNVPVKDGRVSDATRLERLLPGLAELAGRGARVIVISHFGRPQDGRDPRLSLAPVANKLRELLGKPVAFAEDCVGAPAERTVAALPPGGIAVLENLRFHGGEEKNDPAFARRLAALGDLFVNDAFSAAHRAHASTAALAGLLPSYAGPLLLEEINALNSVLENPKRPTAAVIGGAKVSSKISVLKNLIAKVDILIVGGGMANTFLLAQGGKIGRSLAEPDLTPTALEIIGAAKARHALLLLPDDVVVAERLAAGVATHTVPALATPDDQMILDVGGKTVARYTEAIEGAKTLLWNGPLGAFEVEPFARGTIALAQAVAKLTKAGRLLSVAGGGDTVAALNAAGVTEDFSYVSTAGGAFLEWLEGRELPGIVALARAP